MRLGGSSPAAGGGRCVLLAASRPRGRLPSPRTALPPAGRGPSGARTCVASGLLRIQRPRQGESQQVSVFLYSIRHYSFSSFICWECQKRVSRFASQFGGLSLRPTWAQWPSLSV